MEGRALTAQVLENVFTHDHNAREVVAQEYRLAKEHLSEVMRYRDSANPEHQRRFRDALDRQEAAREAYVGMLSR